MAQTLEILGIYYGWKHYDRQNGVPNPTNPFYSARQEEFVTRFTRYFSLHCSQNFKSRKKEIIYTLGKLQL